VNPSRGSCPVYGKCAFGVSSVTYYEHHGESV
jgi:hypothetical protein